ARRQDDPLDDEIAPLAHLVRDRLDRLELELVALRERLGKPRGAFVRVRQRCARDAAGEQRRDGGRREEAAAGGHTHHGKGTRTVRTRSSFGSVKASTALFPLIASCGMSSGCATSATATARGSPSVPSARIRRIA